MSDRIGRAVLGFVAGALAVLTFHQGIIGLLHATHVIDFTAYSMSPVPPFGVPRVFDLAFWGGAWGVLYGLVSPGLPGPEWLKGIGLGVAANLVAWFVIAPLRGQPLIHGWAARPIELGLLINCFWGLGVGLIFPSMIRGGRLARA
ncbi:MAG TPA: hypothetical protein VLI93_04395 [Acetobacteraceae bacterium]|nr:hypothetical protein [Acetobacteraceae bacterium]